MKDYNYKSIKKNYNIGHLRKVISSSSIKAMFSIHSKRSSKIFYSFIYKDILFQRYIQNIGRSYNYSKVNVKGSK